MLPGYAAHRARGALGLPDEIPRVEAVGAGQNTVIRRWPTRALGALYLRAWPWNARVKPARAHAAASQAFQEAGLQVPRILLVDDSFSTMRRWRMEIVIETEAEGEHLDLRRPDHRRALEELARQLAAMHERTSHSWGKPWRPENDMKNPRAYWEERLWKLRRRITPEASALDPALVRRALADMEKRIEALRFSRPALIHGDLNRKNFFIAPGGGLTWIDFVTAQYGLAEQDLAAAEAMLSVPGAYEPFLRTYLAAAGPGRGIDAEAIETFALLRLWEQLAVRIQKRRHRLQRGATGGLETIAAKQAELESRIARRA
jgi:aminoglycoside phosphotransferase (APT) family kinase protein